MKKVGYDKTKKILFLHTFNGPLMTGCVVRFALTKTSGMKELETMMTQLNNDNKTDGKDDIELVITGFLNFILSNCRIMVCLYAINLKFKPSTIQQ